MSPRRDRWSGIRGMATENILVVVLVAIALLLMVTIFGQKISRLFSAATTGMDKGKGVADAKILDSAVAPNVGLDGTSGGSGTGGGGGLPGGGTVPTTGGGGGTPGPTESGSGGSGTGSPANPSTGPPNVPFTNPDEPESPDYENPDAEEIKFWGKDKTKNKIKDPTTGKWRDMTEDEVKEKDKKEYVSAEVTLLSGEKELYNNQIKLLDIPGGDIKLGVDANMSGSVTTSGTGIKLSGGIEVTAGVTAEAEKEVTLSSFDFAGQKFKVVANVKAEALVGGTAGVSGEGTADLKEGLGANAKAEAFVGAKGSVGAGARLLWLNPDTGKYEEVGAIKGVVEGSAGAGASAEFDIGYVDGKLTFTASASATLGVGAGGKVQFELNGPAAVKMTGAVAKNLGERAVDWTVDKVEKGAEIVKDVAVAGKDLVVDGATTVYNGGKKVVGAIGDGLSSAGSAIANSDYAPWNWGW